MASEVGPIDNSKKNSEVLGPTGDEATVQMDQLEEKCCWNDVEYSTGDQVANDGKCYECSFSRWIEIEG